MNVCLLTLWSDSLSYTVVRAVSFAGHRVLVWVADVERDRSSDWSLSKRLAAIPEVQVVADRSAIPPRQIDRLIVQGHPHLLHHRETLELLASRAERLTLISAGDRSRPYRQALKLQWREWLWHGPLFRKVDRVAYKDGYYSLDLLGIARSRRVVGFDPHSKFLQDETLFRAIHARDWDPKTPRPIRANFMGSRDPKTRSHILDSVERYFSSVTPAGGGQRMLWHVYSDAAPAALSGEAFLGVLTESDFTLAPPGYSRVTHRPVEALLRGSIPVLNADELDLYDLGLVDGVNCIAVSTDGWPAAMERIMRMSRSEVVAMRVNVDAMLDTLLAYAALARNMSRRLGLEDSDAAGTAMQ